MGRKVVILLSLVLILFISSCNHNQLDLPVNNITEPSYFDWAKTIQGARGYSVSADNSGNCIVTGDFIYSLKLDSIKVNSNSNWGSFLAKYNSRGEVQWAVGGDYEVTNYYRTIEDNSGNIFVCGHFQNGAEYRNDQYFQNDASILKLSGSGEIIWTLLLASYPSDMCLDKNGNLYVSANVVYKISPDGNIIYSTKPSNQIFAIDAFSVNNNGEVCITGILYPGSTTFDNITLNTTFNEDLYIAKYDASGKCMWAKNYGHGDYINGSYGLSLVFDNTGNIYLLGSCDGDYSIEGYNFKVENYNCPVFLATYSDDGKIRWIKTLFTSNSLSGMLRIDKNNNLYLCGEYPYTINIAPFSSNPSHHSIIISKFDTDIHGIWIEYAGFANVMNLSDFCIDANGTCFITGDEYDGVTFGSYSFPDQGDHYFLAKLFAH